jgi:hypothetical protein
MTVAELLETAQFLVDTDGKRKAVLFDYPVWEELLTLLEDLEDAEEIRRLRESGEEAISWDEAKMTLADRLEKEVKVFASA